MSALSVVLELAIGGRLERFVVRRYGSDVEDPEHAIACEHAVLQRLAGLGVSAPQPVLLDLSRTTLESPFVVVRYVEGVTHVGSDDPIGMALSMADVLADMHERVPAESVADLDLDRREDVIAGHLASPPPRLDESTREPLVREILLGDWPPAARNAPCLLHGDFWPGNVVWHDGHVAAIIDWEGACVGDPLADLGSSRLDVLWFLGQAACDEFTDRYIEVSGVDAAHLPLWDLVAALRPAGDVSHWAEGLPALGRADITPSDLRADLVGFVERAVSTLER